MNYSKTLTMVSVCAGYLVVGSGCASSNVHITSRPSGASVYNTDGRHIGRTPLMVSGSTLLPDTWLIDGINTPGHATLRLDGCEDEVVPFHELSMPDTISAEFSRCRPPPPAPSPSPASVPWRSRARWRTLQLGMSEGNVKSILGEPGEISRQGALQKWHYPNASGGTVRFSRGVVTGWDEPPGQQ